MTSGRLAAIDISTGTMAFGTIIGHYIPNELVG